MSNSKHEKKIVYGLAKAIVQKLVEVERNEWPPSTSYGFYQPKRPEKETEKRKA